MILQDSARHVVKESERGHGGAAISVNKVRKGDAHLEALSTSGLFVGRQGHAGSLRYRWILKIEELSEKVERGISSIGTIERP